jgi:drug/metabolite transporter (DMT)-like permease
MAMFLISNLAGSSIQITTLPLPVLSTLQASGLVFNSACATLILGEPFTRWSLGGTLLVCGGAVLIALYGAIPEPAHNLDQLLGLLHRRAFVLWVVAQTVIVVAIAGGASWLKHVRGISNSPRGRLIRGLAYGLLSGILSAHSLLVSKVAVELLVRTIVDKKNQFDRWQSWFILLSIVTLALTQLYFLHRGLKLVSTSVLYPLAFCVYNIIAILDGLIYFQQTDKLSHLAAGLIALGTVVVLSGVLCLSWGLNEEQSTPTVSASALTPGLGLVEDTDVEDDDVLFAPDDDEAASLHQRLIDGEPMTPTTKYDAVLGATRQVRKVAKLPEAEEIWGELDDAVSPSRSARAGEPINFRHVDERTSLLHPANPPTSPTMTTPHRKRRRSTGFPGFHARAPTHRRQLSSASLQRHEERKGLMSRIFEGRWWKWGSRDDAEQ